QRDEMHPGMIEAVVTLVAGSPAEALEIFGYRGIGGVVLAGYRVKFGNAQTREQLAGQIEFGRLGQVGDIAGVDDERGLLRQGVDEIDGAGERSRHVGIRVLVET